MTVDTEDWYQTSDFNFPLEQWTQYEDRIEHSTDIVLRILSRYEVKATFFILGCLAEKHPDLIRRIAKEGHEIGSHGYWHQMLTHMEPSGFRKDLLESNRILENLACAPVKLFRAPSWSIDTHNLWVLKILEEEGFVCDSSIQPFRTPLSGMKEVPFSPYHPIIDETPLSLIEFPPSVIKIGKACFPFAGGLYLRMMPYSLVSRALRWVNKDSRGMVYVHPWEFDTKQPRIKAPLHVRFMHYYNLGTTLYKLERLLQDFSFMTLGEAIKNEKFPAYTIK